ncbi:single-strand DNA-binding protein [Desulfohalotomaculum tongense]|uniref:single-stranded DNA-binding protein n=1 Tax=Desulforadius tongensis TaxID=1216062 RepID=UPI00195EC8C3|nr:single-stranded DNA-binding protein [Desulforadius tongensis]MBM7855800.1 single-strand DNA-binding protein [Desulforadius tongensis]
MLNKIILIGRLTRDPEPRYTTSGVAVTKFTLAVDRPFANRQGERETDFIDVVTWQKLAEICANNLSKGRLVAVEGRLQIRSYDDNQGIRRKAAEVVADNVRFLDRAKERADAPAGQESYSNADAGGFASEISFSDDADDVPF